ncbi:hypothetical protein [uncultured Campylobacter sp.]|uniref:hypothetical protein n=1 Tax=uncultured Campylobacter sp. TaxID=218934 RepID=UPI00260DD7FD|nr:hypothetical protein [uncultured Campylobacter sp.]
MDGKSGFRPAGDRECTPLNLACLPCLFGFFCALIVRTPNVRPLCDTARSNTCDRKCINTVKFYLILRSLNLKFSPQNLIAPKF